MLFFGGGVNSDGVGGTNDDADGTVSVVYGRDDNGIVDFLGGTGNDDFSATASFMLSMSSPRPSSLKCLG